VSTSFYKQTTPTHPSKKIADDHGPNIPSLSGTVGPFLRAWDEWAGHQPDESNRMLARAPKSPLSTHECRKNAPATHADWWIYKHTPFISFVSSKSSLKTFLGRRCGDWHKNITVINPNVRVARGIQVIKMESEMKYYGVNDPYENRYVYYKDEWICLWEVAPDEVVGCWKWEDLEKDRNWYRM
jgi:hypothetical protein